MYRPCPTGMAQAVVVDVIDLGLVESTFNGEKKTSHKIDVVFQVDERRDDGERFLIKKRYTLSFHPKATLRKDVETWRGKPFSDEELEQMGGFEVNDLIGWQGLVNVVHNNVGDKTYANITAITPLMKGMAKLEAEPYVRRAPKAQTTPVDDTETVDDDIPF